MLISGDDKRNSPLFLARQLPAVVAYLAQHKQLNKQGHRTALTQTAGATTRTCHTSLHVTEIQQNGIKTYLAPCSGRVFLFCTVSTRASINL